MLNEIVKIWKNRRTLLKEIIGPSIKKNDREYVEKLNLKNISNPFKDPRFNICYAEGDGRIIKSQNVCGVRIESSNNTFSIKFKRKEFIISSWIIAMVGNGGYGYDALREVFLNGKILENKNDRTGDFVNFISKLDELKEDNLYEIKYSSTERGDDGFRVNGGCIFFEVTPDYPDLFFFEEKCKKLYSQEDTEEI